jgi:uncharacterized membrane protein
VKLRNNSAALMLSLYLVGCLFVLILCWALSLRKPNSTLKQVNSELFEKAQWAYTFRREMKGERE